MVTWAVVRDAPVHGAGRFTTVVCPDPDGLQTSGVTLTGDAVGAVVAVGTAVGVAVALGEGVAVGTAKANWAATRPDEARRADAGDGTPAAVTTLPTSRRHANAARPVTGRRETIP
jgi:hypothetical protein